MGSAMGTGAGRPSSASASPPTSAEPEKSGPTSISTAHGTASSRRSGATSKSREHQTAASVMNNRLPRGRRETAVNWERRKAEMAARKAAALADPVRGFYLRHGQAAGPGRTGAGLCCSRGRGARPGLMSEPVRRAMLERMVDKRPQADRLLIAELYGEARHRAQWRELTSAEETAAVAELRQLAGGRADLLAEVAGILEGAHEGELDEPLARQAAALCRKAGADETAIPAWIQVGGGGGRTPGGRRSQTRAAGVPGACEREPNVSPGRRSRVPPAALSARAAARGRLIMACRPAGQADRRARPGPVPARAALATARPATAAPPRAAVAVTAWPSCPSGITARSLPWPGGHQQAGRVVGRDHGPSVSGQAGCLRSSQG